MWRRTWRWWKWSNRFTFCLLVRALYYLNAIPSLGFAFAALVGADEASDVISPTAHTFQWLHSNVVTEPIMQIKFFTPIFFRISSFLTQSYRRGHLFRLLELEPTGTEVPDSPILIILDRTLYRRSIDATTLPVYVSFVRCHNPHYALEGVVIQSGKFNRYTNWLKENSLISKNPNIRF